MPEALKGNRPDVTMAQKIAVGLGGIPVLSNLLAAYGVYTPTPAQEHALGNAVNWGSTMAGVLVAGDAVIRLARNHADAKVQAAALMPADPSVATGPQTAPVDADHAELMEADEELPDDDEEFASPPPDESNMPLQPSQSGIVEPDPPR